LEKDSTRTPSSSRKRRGAPSYIRRARGGRGRHPKKPQAALAPALAAGLHLFLPCSFRRLLGEALQKNSTIPPPPRRRAAEIDLIYLSLKLAGSRRGDAVEPYVCKPTEVLSVAALDRIGSRRTNDYTDVRLHRRTTTPTNKRFRLTIYKGM
jgi:hypothetical protein